ncbi:hypothetical protein L530_0497 [Bordetella bronchiseptica MO211]|nr:hypothetical protein L530_0497 [Bordetella bronchiseptica MO211]
MPGIACHAARVPELCPFPGTTEKMHASEQIVSEDQAAKKIATLWAYCHGAPVPAWVLMAELWFRRTPAGDTRTWRALEAHLRKSVPS